MRLWWRTWVTDNPFLTALGEVVVMALLLDLLSFVLYGHQMRSSSFVAATAIVALKRAVLAQQR